MSRKVDDLGRIVLPAEMRKSFGIREGDRLDISVEEEQIILSRHMEGCVFCRSTDDLKEFKDRYICATCTQELSSSNGRSWEPFSPEESSTRA